MRPVLTGILLTALLAGCAALTSSLGGAAARMDDSAQRFYLELRREASTDHETRDAGALAEAARDFKREVQRGTPREDLHGEFDRVGERFHHVRERYDDGRGLDSEEQRRFDDVTQAYLELEAAMKYRRSGYHG
jgi:hypothetical protein